MKYAAIPLAQTIVHLCAAKGIDHIVISPGSRNAPLTIGFTNHPEITTFSIVDERCAAFFALGLAQQLRRPVAVVCTSGSALLNYYPAVAEAFYSDLPLVVISADRPDALQEIGDGQTIQQQNVYGNHILYSANAREGSAHQRYNETELNVALNTAIECRGPVHINLPFSEPLYDTVAKPSVQPQNVPAREPVPSLPDDFSFFQKTWRGSERILVLWGVDFPGSVAPQLLQKLADDERVLVLTETPSNVHHPAFVPAIDQLIAPLSEEALLQLKPDLLLTMGGMVVSKKVKAFLRNHRPAQHWHVDTKKAYNTYFSLTHAISSSPRHFLEALLKDTDAQRGTYQPKWLQVKEHRLQRHAAYVAEIPFSDFKVFYAVFNALPTNIQLQLANSTTIRYSQLFAMHPSWQVFCNRGTSGIDGSSSTAIGAAYAADRQTVLLTGDLSFFYDSNALWNQYIRKDFRIVVINNSGGGIFRILPKAKEMDHFEQFFETRHGLRASQLCDMFGFGYRHAHDWESLKTALQTFFSESNGPQLLEISTPPEVNDGVLRDYFSYIA